MKSISDNDIENNININLLPLQSEPLCGKNFILGMFAITLIVSLILILSFSL